MTVIRPNDDAISSAAAHYGLHLDAATRQELAGLVDSALGSYDVVDDLYADESFSAPSRIMRHLMRATIPWAHGT